MTRHSTATTASATNTSRQLHNEITTLPANGARIGDTLITSISNAIRRAASWPVYRSRTIARGITIPAHAPKACKARKPINTSMLGANAQPTLATVKITSPA